jgi:hypothetical protein
VAADNFTEDHELGISIVHRLLGDDVDISDIQVVDEHELSFLVGPDMVEQLMAMLGRSHPELYTPRRGTPQYREMLEQGARTSDMDALTRGINHIWSSYRWPGVVDYMELLIKRICDHSNHLVEDAAGVPQLHLIIRTGQNEADLLETAVAVSNEPDAQAHGFGFSNALELGKRLVGYIEAWRPGFQEALRAQSGGHPEQVRPALVRLPGLRDDGEHVLQGVLVLALAAVAIANPEVARQQLIANGTTPASYFQPVRTRTKGRKGRK